MQVIAAKNDPIGDFDVDGVGDEERPGRGYGRQVVCGQGDERRR
jgi:hypothetical protein